MSDPNLKACPFCGGKDVGASTGHNNITFIKCETCWAVVSFGGRERMAESKRAWNGRPEAQINGGASHERA